ncbi:MAG: D-alanine--D-alanine ligase [Clostridia bacterium]|nr:D-alanine--D-alanine ligase [Clostridia bacterium]
MAEKIAVLYGGISSEREVSLRTGEAVFKGLQSKGYNVVKIDVDGNLVEKLKAEKVDRAFLALHGKYGEDGTIQGLLEILGIPYTGSGVLASSMAMNKIITKKLLQLENLPTPKFKVVNKYQLNKEGLEGLNKAILAEIQPPMVVKAANQGSTIGISFVRKAEELGAALEDSFKYDHEVLIEEFIEGIELTASVMGNNEPRALTLLEIQTSSGVYDYDAKYTVGGSSHFPPNLPAEKQREIQDLAVKTYLTIGCRGLARIDFILDAQGVPYILEVNTMPGMTETSLFPDAAKLSGIAFPDLVEKIIELSKES